MNWLQEAEVELIDRKTCNLITWYNGIIAENMICAGLESGAADACQVMLLGHFSTHYRLQVSVRHGCVFLRVTAGAPCSVTARTRRGFIWSEWQASGISVDFLTGREFMPEQAGFRAGWQDRRHQCRLHTDWTQDWSQLCSVLLWFCSETSR